MIECVEGIIINSTNYGETSKILNIFTKEYGVVGVISKGCKSLKSKNRNVSENFTYGKFNIYYKKNKLSTLIECSIIDNLKTIKSDIIKIGYLTYICELINNVVKQSDDKDIYNLLISAILKINEGFDSKIITNILEVKLLDYLGVSISLDSCVHCNSKSVVTLSPYRGGFICGNCLKGEKLADPKTLKMLRLYYYVDINKISELKINDKIRDEIDWFLSEYYDHFTGLYIKSKKFLKNLNKTTKSN